jgi:hypothetical protein
MSGHTPGPWEYVEDVCGSRVVADGYGFSAPYRLEPGSGRDPQQVADNKLIAAAPDLLAACEAADRILWMAEAYAEAGGTHGPEMRDYNEAAPLIKAAIAKARTK